MSPATHNKQHLNALATQSKSQRRPRETSFMASETQTFKRAGQSALTYLPCSVLPHPLPFQFREVSQVTVVQEKHCQGIIFLQTATGTLPGQRPTLSSTDPAPPQPTTNPSSPQLCAEPPGPLTSPLQTWSEAPGHNGSPAALSHGKSLRSNYSTLSLIIRPIYLLVRSFCRRDQREERDGRRAACTFARDRRYVTVHPTHRQALQICFSHQCDARGKTSVLPSCLFRTAETLECILGLLETRDFQLFAVIRGA